MPSPRDQAQKYNPSSGFGTDNYDGVAGAPAGVMPQGKEQDYGANPTNPSEPSPPATNLKG